MYKVRPPVESLLHRPYRAVRGIRQWENTEELSVAILAAKGMTRFSRRWHFLLGTTPGKTHGTIIRLSGSRIAVSARKHFLSCPATLGGWYN